MRTRPVLAGLLVAALSIFGVVAVATPASAAVVFVGTGPNLQTALDASVDLTTVVTLSAPIDLSGGQVLVTHTATIDLNGFNLSAESVVLSSGVTLKVVDSFGGGVLTADASGSPYDAGIYTTGATLLLAGATVVATGSAQGGAIGSKQGEANTGSITISSGDVTATSGAYSAGIGGGVGSSAGTISITGGTVHAEGGRGAGIGSGQGSAAVSGSVSISGGTVTATTRANTNGAAIGAGALATIGSISISAGTVTASVDSSSDGAAIGVGSTDPGPTIPGTAIAISGGTVTATGGEYGAAIGGGGWSYGGSITISGGATVSAHNGPNGAAIGSGFQGQTVSVTITGGTVHTDNPTTGGDHYGAGIGSGRAAGVATISISGGTVIADAGDGTSNSYGAAIGSGGGGSASPSITITAGAITASGSYYGSAIGGGSNGGSGVILISGGTVGATAGSQFGAGIGSGINAYADSITISGGFVTATGSLFGAAIGGGYGGAGGTINLTGGAVEAHHVYHGAAIGGGQNGDGAAVTIGATAFVSVISDAGAAAMSAIGSGDSGVSWGSLSVSGTLVLGSATSLTVPGTTTVTVMAGGLIKGVGSLNGTGYVANHGSIQNTDVNTNVTDHNYLVTFEPNLASATPATATGVRVYATNFIDGDRSFPNYSETTGDWNFAGWGDTASSPVTFAASTSLSADRTAYAVWAPHTLRISISFASILAGTTLTFTTDGLDQSSGSLGDLTDRTVFTTDSPEPMVGNQIQFLTIGTYTVSATIGGYTSDATIVVNAGPLDHLYVTPDASSVIAGHNTVFTAEGYDIGNNPLGDMTSSASWSSSQPDLHTDSDFYFTSPTGSRTITATVGAVSDSTTISVLGADVDHLEITPTNPTLVAGATQAFTVAAFDAFNNNLGDYTSLVTVTSTAPSDSISGASVSFTTSGFRTIRAALTANTSVYIETGVDVDHSAPTWENIYTNDSGLVAGDSATFYVDGNDAHGNGFDLTNDVTYSSDDATDTHVGNVFTFTTSGHHIIHAVYGSLTDTVDVYVAPGAPDYLVVSTATTGTVVAGGTRTITAASFDSYGNYIADVTASSTFSSSYASDVVSTGNSFYLTQAGTRAISAELIADSSVTGSLNLTVIGDTSHPASMTITASTTTIDQYGTVTFAVAGFDQFGNPISGLESLATITSDMPTDVISGNTITFPHASPHNITATLGTATATLLIQVRPAALAFTGVDVASQLTPAILMLLLGIALVAFRRRRRA